MIGATLKDGFGIAVSFGVGKSGTNHSGISLVIDPTSITPPGLDGGDLIDTTTHSNDTYRTKHTRSLIDLTDCSCTVAYDPAAWASILAAVNDNVLITFTFTDGSSVAFYGYIKNLTPNEFVEGEMPTAECTFVVTNINNTTGAETAPDYTAGS
jgi:hypothetical protein